MKSFKNTIKAIALLLVIVSTTSCEKVNLCEEKGTLIVTNKSLHTVQKIIINGVSHGTIDPEEKKEIQLSEGQYSVEIRGVSGGDGCSDASVIITECEKEGISCSS